MSKYNWKIKKQHIADKENHNQGIVDYITHGLKLGLNRFIGEPIDNIIVREQVESIIRRYAGDIGVPTQVSRVEQNGDELTIGMRMQLPTELRHIMIDIPIGDLSGRH